MRVLAELGCDVAQGFLLSRPIAPEALAVLAREPQPAEDRTGTPGLANAA